MNPMTQMLQPRVAALRAEDQAPMRALIEAISAMHRNAVVVCEDDLVLDAIGVQLARALRRQPALQLELYQPSSTEALLARFNGMLADLPLQAAQATLQPHDRLRVWVLHLTQRRDLADVQLLLRLVQGFPGAGVRLLLLLSQDVAADRSMAGLGPRVHRWDVEPDQSAPVLTSDEDIPTAARPSYPAGQEAVFADEPAAPDNGKAGRWLHRIRMSGRRAVSFGGTARSLMARMPSPVPQRWLLGVFGVALATSGSLAAWWHSKPASSAATAPTATRPVPEILEVVDSRAALRPAGVRAMEP